MTDPILQNSEFIQHHWKVVSEEILQENFAQWLPLYEIDLETGNPIYSIYEPLTNKAVRIIHSHSPAQNGIYMRKAGAKDMTEDTIDEIVFCFPFTESATNFFRTVFKVWIDESTSSDYMLDFIFQNKSVSNALQ